MLYTTEYILSFLIMRYLLPISLFALTLVACNTSVPTANDNTETTYNQDSWQTMIDDSCISFFDGCNNCQRNTENNLAACTKKFCQTYEKPECLDK